MVGFSEEELLEMTFTDTTHTDDIQGPKCGDGFSKLRGISFIRYQQLL
jgi:hypothetical protein